MFLVEKTQTGNYKLGLYEKDSSSIPATINFGQLNYIIYVFQLFKNNKLPLDYMYSFTDIHNNLVVLKLIKQNKLLYGVLLDDSGFTLEIATLDGKIIKEILERIKQC